MVSSKCRHNVSVVLTKLGRNENLGNKQALQGSYGNKFVVHWPVLHTHISEESLKRRTVKKQKNKNCCKTSKIFGPLAKSLTSPGCESLVQSVQQYLLANNLNQTIIMAFTLQCQILFLKCLAREPLARRWIAIRCLTVHCKNSLRYCQLTVQDKPDWLIDRYSDSY